jgi:carbon-monoxide dehydrogenase medium subunit
VRAIQYAAPETLPDAVALLAQHGTAARVLAGGTDLIVQVRENVRHVQDVEVFVDGKHIPELTELSFDPTRGLTLGAAVPCYRLSQDAQVARLYPGLLDGASIIGGTAIQGRATVGGNLCNAGPAADSTPALIVLSAVARIAGPQGEREVPVEEFCVAPGVNVLQPGELLVSLRLPPPAPGSGARYLRFIPRNEMDIAEVGAGASVELDAAGTIRAARIALGAVAPRPLFVPEAGEALVGRTADDESFAAAAAVAQAIAQPIDDHRGTAEHRRHLVGVLTKRALRGAVERARSNR